MHGLTDGSGAFVEDGIVLAELAREIGVPYRRLRAWVRYRWPRDPEALGAPWQLTSEQAQAALTHFLATGQVGQLDQRVVMKTHPPARPARLSVAREALKLRAQADRLLAAAGLTRNNVPLAGQLAEKLVLGALGGTLAGAAQAGYDVMLDDGKRVQVKARMAGVGELGKQVFMRGLANGARPFDQLVVLQFDPEYELDWAFRFEFEAVVPFVRYVPHNNSWRLTMTGAMLARGEDLTEAIRSAFDSLP